MVKVELVYIDAVQNLVHQQLSVAPGATVADALRESGILQARPELQGLPLGIFSKPAQLDTVLKPGDRIEFYRPLSLDPKEKRRQRAKTK